MRLNSLAEILSGAERHFLARLDLNRFAGGGVASHAGGAPTHLKGSEPGNADPAPFLRCSPIKAIVPASTSFACFCESPWASPTTLASWRSVTSSTFAGFAAVLPAAAALAGAAVLAATAGLREDVVLATPDFVFIAFFLSLPRSSNFPLDYRYPAPVDPKPGLSGRRRSVVGQPRDIDWVYAALA